MKKYYKDYNIEVLGSSDSARLKIIDSVGGISYINFNADGGYNAYIVDENAEIGAHYKLINTYHDYIVVCDDMGISNVFKAYMIKIYRAGNFGCIVQLINK